VSLSSEIRTSSPSNLIIKGKKMEHIALETVVFSISEGIARISINRPEKRNALSLQTVRELQVALHLAEKDASVRVAILSGTGTRVFAAGADLDELPEAFTTPQTAMAYDQLVNQLYDALQTSRLPIIASMAGHAIGGGCLLALACDLRIAASHIKVGFPVARIGLMLSPKEHQLILAQITPSQARLLMFTGRRIDAIEAQAWGLIDIAVVQTDLEAATAQLAAEIVVGAPLAIRVTKNLVQALASHEDVERSVTEAYETIYTSSDLKEGLRAIENKRVPKFLGR
jgi:enoyl-CoA hydratase